ncbi:hypothetical protein FA95DRAFT_1313508 [Auriscalpium vulgare]|uniref:Uncharacterized protein n=1 Tax=Auriscalpium vulgare TaxID=40419 RepID=A0ACB8R354_9AGAM|nr:hypothetical protein FA95DRAFT_1313508 [Auriscalpium vulgare]
MAPDKKGSHHPTTPARGERAISAWHSSKPVRHAEGSPLFGVPTGAHGVGRNPAARPSVAQSECSAASDRTSSGTRSQLLPSARRTHGAVSSLISYLATKQGPKPSRQCWRRFWSPCAGAPCFFPRAQGLPLSKRGTMDGVLSCAMAEVTNLPSCNGIEQRAVGKFTPSLSGLLVCQAAGSIHMTVECPITLRSCVPVTRIDVI